MHINVGGWIEKGYYVAMKNICKSPWIEESLGFSSEH